MGATDSTITLVNFLKFEAPSGDVRLCDGGFIDFGGERYESVHPVFGTLVVPDEFDESFGDQAPGATISFLPDPDAGLADWFSADLANCRLRIWQGELDADGVTVSTAEMLDDLLVDLPRRLITANGIDVLELTMVSRQERLFLTNEGNVCSQRQHQSVWPGEKGMNNCTDLYGFVAWGAATPPRGSGAGGSSGAGRNWLSAFR